MQFYSLAQTSLAKSGSGVVEEYVPLWMADGTNVGINSTSTNYLTDGGIIQATVTSATKIHTLNSNWSASQKFAFEATIWISSAGITTNASLYDLTSTPTIVSGATVSTTSATATVVRSGQFTLIPGHVYGVAIWVSNASYTGYCADASLIVFGQ